MNKYVRIGDYYDGYAKVKYNDGKYGFVHLNGTLLPEKYVAVESFKNGVANVTLESGRTISINIKGEFVRDDYTEDDFMKEKQRENNKYRLKEIIDNSIDEMNLYIENMFDYIEKITSNNLKKRGN